VGLGTLGGRTRKLLRKSRRKTGSGRQRDVTRKRGGEPLADWNLLAQPKSGDGLDQRVSKWYEGEEIYYIPSNRALRRIATVKDNERGTRGHGC